MAYASPKSTSPKVRAVTTTPAEGLDPMILKPKLKVAAPTPKKTKKAVPTNSANKDLVFTGPPFRSLGRMVAQRDESQGDSGAKIDA
jgi:hypothetical protein